MASTETSGDLKKQPSGMPGLDEVLEGGFPQQRVSVIRGAHGAGKTVLGLNFLYQNALSGTPGLFVTFEEDADSIRENAHSMGWDLARMEAEKKVALLALNVSPLIVTSGEFDIGATIAIIRHAGEAIGAKIIVLDAVDWLLNLFENAEDRRRHLQAIFNALREAKFTAVFTIKDTREEADLLEFMADCIVRLDQRVESQVTVRRLRVTKYRGSGFLSNEHPFTLMRSGPNMLPVSSITLSYGAVTGRVSSGNAVFDEHLGGGFFRGGCALIAGSTGTGKTTFLSNFTAAACAAGERVLYVSLEESSASLVQGMHSAGIDLQPCIDSGNLRFRCILPEAMGTDQQLLEILDTMDDFRPDHVVVDPITAVERMGNAVSAFDFQIRLFYLCKNRAVTCLSSFQARESVHADDIGRLELSSLSETVISLEQKFLPEGFFRYLAIIKSRGTLHSDGLYQFWIHSDGLKISQERISSTGYKQLRDVTLRS